MFGWGIELLKTPPYRIGQRIHRWSTSTQYNAYVWPRLSKNSTQNTRQHAMAPAHCALSVMTRVEYEITELSERCNVLLFTQHDIAANWSRCAWQWYSCIPPGLRRRYRDRSDEMGVSVYRHRPMLWILLAGCTRCKDIIQTCAVNSDEHNQTNCITIAGPVIARTIIRLNDKRYSWPSRHRWYWHATWRWYKLMDTNRPWNSWGVDDDHMTTSVMINLVEHIGLQWMDHVL